MTKNGNSGLCSTCDGRATCTFPKYEDRPKLFCEEFDWWSQYRMETTARIKPRVRQTEAPATVEARKTSKYKGLCANCDNQNGCAYSKPADVVWQCEEFV